MLDAIGISDIDYTGSRAFREALDSFDREHATFAVARAGAHMRESLTRSGLLHRIGEDHFFDSVDEAVKALLPEAPDAPRG